MIEKNYSDLQIKYSLAFKKEYCAIMCDIGWYDFIEAFAKDLTNLNMEYQKNITNIPEDEQICECSYSLQDHKEKITLQSIEKWPCENFTLALARIDEIKEKFGGARISLTTHLANSYELMVFYENLSYCICEYCGAPGELREDLSWIKTLCEKCYKESLDPKINH